MKKYIFLTTIALITVIALYLSSKNYSDKVETNRNASSKITKVTVAQTGDFLLYSALYIALDAGYFQNNGLEVKIISTGGDEKSVAAVLSGQAEFGVGDPTFAAIASERGQGVEVISSVVNGVPFWGITYSPKTVKQYQSSGLAGLKTATFPSPSTAYTLQKDMYEDNDLEPNIVQGAFGSLIGILASGNADIALELEPNVSTAVESGASILYSMTKLYGDFAITGVTASSKYTKDNPEIARNFIRSLQSAMNLARSDRPTVLDLLDDRFPELGNSIVEASLNRMITDNVIPKTAVISDSAWKKAVDLRVEVGDIKDADKAYSILNMQFTTP